MFSGGVEVRLPLPKERPVDPHVLQLCPGAGPGRRLVQVIDLRPGHGEQEGRMGGEDQLAPEEPDGVLQKPFQLQLQSGGEAVLRLVQKIQGVFPDGLGEIRQGALPVGALRHVFHQMLPQEAGLGHGLGVGAAAPGLIVLQGLEGMMGMAVGHILLQQADPGGVDAVVDAADVQQVVEDIVAGDDPAPLGNGAVGAAAEGGVVPEKVAAVVYGAPPQVQGLRHDIEDGGLSAAVAAV